MDIRRDTSSLKFLWRGADGCHFRLRIGAMRHDQRIYRGGRRKQRVLHDGAGLCVGAVRELRSCSAIARRKYFPIRRPQLPVRANESPCIEFDPCMVEGAIRQR